MSISSIKNWDTLESLVSVYLIAAAGSPSTEPKLPWPSMRGKLIENSWTILTKASYTDWSPCGWYLPITSPTTLADFLNCFDQSYPPLYIA